MTLRRKADTAEPPSKPETRPTPSPTTGNGNKTLGYVLGGVGIVGLGVAGVTGIMLAGDRSTMSGANCDATARTCSGPKASDGVSAADHAPIVTVFYGSAAVGIVALAAGAYFVLSATDDAPVAIRVSPRGAAIEGRF